MACVSFASKKLSADGELSARWKLALLNRVPSLGHRPDG